VSLDFHLRREAFHANCTHNLIPMAEACGLYEPLWGSSDVAHRRASEIVEPLRAGIRNLERGKDVFVTMNPTNGWGTYEGLLEFARKVLRACEEEPEAFVEVSR